MLPTLAVIKKEKTTDYIVGLDELGGTDDFNTARARITAPHRPAAACASLCSF